MMKRHLPTQRPLLGPALNLDARIPADHVLRKIQQAVDFEFVYNEVEHLYGAVGRPSVPPPVLLKMMVLLFLFNVPSERELMRTIPLRLDWLWFLGYELDADVPNHSVLSKARRRWGVDVFHALLRRVIESCVAAGLVGGKKVFIDASLIDANASVDSIVDTDKLARELATRLDGDPEGGGPDAPPPSEPPPSKSSHEKRASARYRSSTDPDATGTKHGTGKMRLRYATHRVVDATAGVITASVIGPGHENEAERLQQVLEQHEEHTGISAQTPVADTKYGTRENLLHCHEAGLTPHIRPYRASYGKREGMFCDCEFRYDAAADLYRCPAGQELTRRQRQKEKGGYRYAAPQRVCAACPARHLCTTSKTAPRRILRLDNQDVIDAFAKQCRSPEARADLKQRFWMMEGSFAQSIRMGYKRARWRGLWRVQIQDLIIAALQNALLLARRAPNYLKRLIRTLFTWLRGPIRTIRLTDAYVTLVLSPVPSLAGSAA